MITSLALPGTRTICYTVRFFLALLHLHISVAAKENGAMQRLFSSLKEPGSSDMIFMYSRFVCLT